MAPLPSEVLAKAADLIAMEGRWSRGHFARDRAGFPCEARSGFAASWCPSGAIQRVSAPLPARPVPDAAYAYLCRHLGCSFVSSWNDAEGRTQAEVASALRKASELAKAEGQ